MLLNKHIFCGCMALLAVALTLDATQAQMHSGVYNRSAVSLWTVQEELQAVSCHAASRPLSVLSLFSPQFTEYSQEQKQKVVGLVTGLLNALHDQSLYRQIKELQDASVGETNIQQRKQDPEIDRKQRVEAFEKEVAEVQQHLKKVENGAEATAQNTEKLFLRYVVAARDGDDRAKEAACLLVRSGELQDYFEERLGTAASARRLRVYVKLLTNNVKFGEGDSCPICKKDFERNDPILVTNPCLHVFCKSCIEGWKGLGKHSCPVCRGVMFSASRRTHASRVHIHNASH